MRKGVANDRCWPEAAYPECPSNGRSQSLSGHPLDISKVTFKTIWDIVADRDSACPSFRFDVRRTDHLPHFPFHWWWVCQNRWRAL